MIIPSSHKVKEGELKGKVILVTGANRGFGLAMTMDLSKAGATVIMLGRDLGALEYAYDAVIDKGFQEPILYPLDIEGATPENYQSLQDDIFNQFEWAFYVDTVFNSIAKQIRRCKNIISICRTRQRSESLLGSLWCE